MVHSPGRRLRDCARDNKSSLKEGRHLGYRDGPPTHSKCCDLADLGADIYWSFLYED